MKKCICLILILSSFILFGCKKENKNVNCTLEQDAYIGTATQSIEISFQKDKFKLANVVLRIEINEGYEDFAQSYYDNVIEEYNALEKLYGIKYEKEEFKNSIKFEYNVDYETFSSVTGIISSDKKDDIINNLTENGYMCK